MAFFGCCINAEIAVISKVTKHRFKKPIFTFDVSAVSVLSKKKRFFADYVQQELSRLVMGPSIASGDSIRDLSALHIQTR